MRPLATSLAAEGEVGNENSFAFFAWLAHVLLKLAERIRSSPARRQEGTRRAWGLIESVEPATLSSCQQSKTVSLIVSEEAMQQPQLTTYADIAEVRTVSGAAACNQLLADDWILLGVYPLTTVAEMGARQPNTEKESQRIEDTQRYVCRVVGYVVGMRRES
jgi:hypothetical protein